MGRKQIISSFTLAFLALTLCARNASAQFFTAQLSSTTQTTTTTSQPITNRLVLFATPTPAATPKAITHINSLTYFDVPGTFNAGTPQGAINDILAAINEWKVNIDTAVHPCPQMTPAVTLDPGPAPSPTPKVDQNNIYFAAPSTQYPYDPSVAAYTVITFGTGVGESSESSTFPVGHDTRGSIFFNPVKNFNNSGFASFPNPWKWRLDKVVKHELGHLLGLTHYTSDIYSIMYPPNITSGTAAKNVTVSDGDLAHANNCQ